MKTYQISILFLLLSTTSSYAAGSGHVGDLFAPAVNFVILFGFIIFKYKGAISKSFTDESIRVEGLLSDAAEADKQATLKLESLEKELSNIESVKNGLKTKANEQLNAQVEIINKESTGKLNKLIDDQELKFEQEKAILAKDVNSRVLDLVINNAKNLVMNDSTKKNKTEEKLISSIQ